MRNSFYHINFYIHSSISPSSSFPLFCIGPLPLFPVSLFSIDKQKQEAGFIISICIFSHLFPLFIVSLCFYFVLFPYSLFPVSLFSIDKKKKKREAAFIISICIFIHLFPSCLVSLCFDSILFPCSLFPVSLFSIDKNNKQLLSYQFVYLFICYPFI